MAFQCGDHQEFDLAISEVDAAGNPVTTSGVTFSSSDESVLTIVQDQDDDSKAVVSAVGALGTATISVTAGELSGSLDVEVIAEAATGINLTPSGLREKADPAPTPEPTPDPTPIPEPTPTPDNPVV